MQITITKHGKGTVTEGKGSFAVSRTNSPQKRGWLAKMRKKKLENFIMQKVN
jgi:hypothetical protein